MEETGMKRNASGRLVSLLLVGLLAVPGTVRAQVQALEQAPPTPLLPLPIGGQRYEEGGPFVGAEFLFWQQSNPLKRQQVAFRGFVDVGGGITGAPGQYVGSLAPALHTDDVSGPITYQPGLSVVGGWRFRDGITLEAGWWHLSDARYSATASLLPQNLRVGSTLADTFISSAVYNFPINYAGASQNVNLGNPGDTFGIWNASSLMTIDFVQRFDMGMINFRVPIDQTEYWRMHGIIGGRAVIMWERFRWRTVSYDLNGQAAADDQAIYSNVVSNRWYGANLGVGGDWFLGDSPLGGFAFSAEIHGSVGVDIVKERAKYELGDFSTAASRAMNEYTISPLVQGDLSLWWYPTQGIQCRLGWQCLAIFNTIASPRPIDFNVGAVAPGYERGIIRFFNGLHVGVAIVF
jgi:hypothetical protein